MKLKKPSTAIYAIGFGILLSCSVAQAHAFDDTELLTRQIKATTFKRQSVDEVLDYLAYEYRIPVGIEFGDDKLTPRREMDFDLPKTNLKDFLDAVMEKDSRYSWKLEGGVIHLRPVTGADSFVSTLLDSKISHFGFTGDVTWYNVYHQVMNLPEISSQLVIADVLLLKFHNFSSGIKLKKNTFFSESNLTLRELLDRIVLKTDIKTWVITRWGENNEYITLRS